VAGESWYSAFQSTILPVIDVNTDLAYILSNVFYNRILFGLVIAVYLLPNLYYVYRICKGSTGLKNFFWWLNYKKIPEPAIDPITGIEHTFETTQPHSNSDQYLLFGRIKGVHGTLCGAALWLLVWLIAILHQFASIILKLFQILLWLRQ
jgi:hypothetical protein